MPRALLLLLLLLVPATAGAAPQVKFVTEMTAPGPLRVAVARDGTVFATGREGGVTVLGRDGRPVMTLPDRDPGGVTVLKKPGGIALDGDRVYVTDLSRDVVVIYSRDGSYLESFGDNGSGPKEFKDPHGIFVDRGVIYVADSANDRVQIFGRNGVYLGSVGEDDEGEGRLRHPLDVAVDPKGRIYVVDGSSQMVKIYGPKGDYAGKLAGLVNPGALAMADDGVFVADREGSSVVKFSFTGDRLFSFGSMGSGKVQFQELAGILADGEGQVYVADTARGIIQVVATDKGKVVGPLETVPPPTSVRWQRDTGLRMSKIRWDGGRERLYAIDDDKDLVQVVRDGLVERTLQVPDWTPSALAVDLQGTVWVTDRGEDRILKFDREGKLLQTIGSPGSRPGFLSKPRGIAVTPDGLVYVADTGNDRVQVFDTEGVFLNVLGGSVPTPELRAPTAVAVDGKGNLYVISAKHSLVFRVAPNGKVHRILGDRDAGRGRLDDPVDLMVAGDEVMVLDAGTNNVKVFRLDGTFVRLFGARGGGKGDFRKPSSLTALDATRFMVADYGNKRLQLLETAHTPTPPAELTATGGMRTIEVKWQAPYEPFVEGYRVYRAKGTPETFIEVATVKTKVFLDTDVTPNLPYHYRVAAVARGGAASVAAGVVKALPNKYRAAAPAGLQATSEEWSVDLKWSRSNEGFVDFYRVYRADDRKDAIPVPAGETREPAFSEGGLEPNTAYVYAVAAVSSDGVESERTPLTVKTRLATKTPLEIDVLAMSNIFSNTYKIYETEGIGRVRLTNNTRDRIASLKLAFAIKEFMDFPSEIEVRDLAAKESREIPLKAVFNNKILEVTEDTPVQTEITATYYENAKPRTYTRNHTISLYEKHRMMWDVKDRVASFITSKDPVLLEFTRSVVTQYGEMNSPLVYAGALFDFLGQMGMTYLQHPTNPYQIKSGGTEYVDYVQYPRETLARNSGVCTDLVVLYCAALESLGIRTLVLGIPGHLFMMFALGPISELGDDTMSGMLVAHDGYLWAPVELTIVGSPFMKAWDVGSKTYNDNRSAGIEMTDLRKAWERYKPATLPFSAWRAQTPSRADVDKRYNNELARLNRITLRLASSGYFRKLGAEPNDVNALLQLGIIYGEGGEPDEALKFLEKAEALSPANAKVMNNLGNIHFLRGEHNQALTAYEKAAELDPADPHILVNLAICNLRLNRQEKAAQAFRKAYGMDREIGKTYRALALELLGGI
jgi:DNA-binding beta-propeller fold protein YncE